MDISWDDPTGDPLTDEQVEKIQEWYRTITITANGIVEGATDGAVVLEPPLDSLKRFEPMGWAW